MSRKRRSSDLLTRQTINVKVNAFNTRSNSPCLILAPSPLAELLLLTVSPLAALLRILHCHPQRAVARRIFSLSSSIAIRILSFSNSASTRIFSFCNSMSSFLNCPISKVLLQKN
jgi:hypothetical protein